MLKHEAPSPQRQIASPDLLYGPTPFPSECALQQFYAGADRGAVLERMVEDIRQCRGIVRLRGESGSGKTMLALALAHRLGQKFTVMRYDHPDVCAQSLVRYLQIESGLLSSERHATTVVSEPGRSVSSAVSAEELAEINTTLIELSSAKPVVLLLDAARIHTDVWPVLNVLCNQDAQGYMYFRCVIFSSQTGPFSNAGGRQPPACTNYYLRKLLVPEIHDFLHHQMLIFDFNRRHMFTREMSRFIGENADGNLRKATSLAREACLIAGIQDLPCISMVHLNQALMQQRELEPQTNRSYFRYFKFRTLALLTVVSVLGVLWLVN